jgi:hypothetical protein
MKFFIALVLSALLATPAAAFVGDWYYDDNPGGSEYVELGDPYSGSHLVLRGYEGRCGLRGDSYSTMRRTIDSNYPYQVEWWIDYDCGSAVRVCVVGDRGQVACSTYINGGWWRD